MQSGRGKQKKWLLEFETRDAKAGPLMGWDASDDTLNQVKLEFNSKENAIEYAKSNNIEYKLIEPQQKKFVIKSYESNFTKN